VRSSVDDTLPFQESAIWDKVHGVWQRVYGDFRERGVSIEWHDFRLNESLEWSDSFHPGSLEICLNYTGSAEWQWGVKARKLNAGQLAIYTTREESPTAARQADSIHRFLTIEFSADYLRRQCGTMLDGLLPGVVKFLENPDRFSPWLEMGNLSSTLLTARAQLLEPPVNTAGLEAWYQGKIFEVLSQTVFRPDKPGELFCDRYRRMNRERVDSVKYLIARDIENPPTLEMLAREVECSPFYLSRLFSESTGMSMPKYLRLKRVEKAAECIRDRGMSVTEAAMKVGYSSLSAFQKAFVEQYGVSPGAYSQR